jgi:hypothetical protein
MASTGSAAGARRTEDGREREARVRANLRGSMGPSQRVMTSLFKVSVVEAHGKIKMRRRAAKRGERFTASGGEGILTAEYLTGEVEA